MLDELRLKYLKSLSNIKKVLSDPESKISEIEKLILYSNEVHDSIHDELMKIDPIIANKFDMEELVDKAVKLLDLLEKKDGLTDLKLFDPTDDPYWFYNEDLMTMYEVVIGNIDAEDIYGKGFKDEEEEDEEEDYGSLRNHSDYIYLQRIGVI
jgi:hypothetical protein